MRQSPTLFRDQGKPLEIRVIIERVEVSVLVSAQVLNHAMHNDTVAAFISRQWLLAYANASAVTSDCAC
jgi:hypothetical protein